MGYLLGQEMLLARGGEVVSLLVAHLCFVFSETEFPESLNLSHGNAVRDWNCSHLAVQVRNPG